MPHSHSLLISLVIAFLLAACTPANASSSISPQKTRMPEVVAFKVSTSVPIATDIPATSTPLPAPVTFTPSPTPLIPTATPTETPSPTSTPLPTDTPIPTATPLPTDTPTPTPNPVDQELVAYLKAVAPLVEQIWDTMPGEIDLAKTDYYSDLVKSLYDQLDAIPVPESAKLMHPPMMLAMGDVALYHLNWTMAWEDIYYFDDYSYNAEQYGDEAMYYYYQEYLPLRDELLRYNGLKPEDVGFSD